MSLFLTALLLLLVAGLAWWGFLRNPPHEPEAQGTALPDRVPGAAPPQQ